MTIDVFRRILPVAVLSALCGGCWTLGSVDEGMPSLHDRFPPQSSFYVEKTEPRVSKALKDAILARGFDVAAVRANADVAVEAKVESWEYGDAGFGGFGRRDDMRVALTLKDVKKGVVVARATVEVRSDFRIFAKYVEKW